MRVLILSVTAGYGHNTAAQALHKELTSRGAKVVLEDLYQHTSRLTYDFIDKGYLFSVKHMKRQYKTAYSTLERNELSRKIISTLSGNSRLARKYAEYFKEYMPDVILVTHVFAAQVLNILKGMGYLKVPIIGIMTDYCIHPFWEEITSLDYLVLGSELLTHTAVKRGIPEKIILPLGVPVRPGFLESVEKEKAREQLGLQMQNTILVMGGSMGYGNILPIVSAIDAMDMGLQLVCICGNNEKLRSRLHYLKTKSRLTICGFVENVNLYMDAADCIVSKPGGITVTEALCKELPMILINPIPGHEEHNVEFLVNNGAAMRVTENFSVTEAVYYMFSNPGRLELMKESIRLIAHPDANKKICDFVFDLAH